LSVHGSHDRITERVVQRFSCRLHGRKLRAGHCAQHDRCARTITWYDTLRVGQKFQSGHPDGGTAR
jgi:hypothetical protein